MKKQCLPVLLATLATGWFAFAAPVPVPAVQVPSNDAANKETDVTLHRLVERVLEAHGGESKLRAIKTFTLELREDKPAGQAATTKYFVQLPDGYRIEFGREGSAEQDIQILLAPDGIHRWKKHADGKIEEVRYLGFDYPREHWLDDVNFLGPRQVLRLRDPDAHLTLLDASQSADRSLVGIELEKTGSQFKLLLRMYFDKESGLLVAKDNVLQKTGTRYRDYKNVAGIMVAGSISDSRDIQIGRVARTAVKSQLVEFKVLDKLDAGLFEKP
jgi:hypothetical protein